MSGSGYRIVCIFRTKVHRQTVRRGSLPVTVASAYIGVARGMTRYQEYVQLIARETKLVARKIILVLGCSRIIRNKNEMNSIKPLRSRINNIGGYEWTRQFCREQNWTCGACPKGENQGWFSSALTSALWAVTVTNKYSHLRCVCPSKTHFNWVSLPFHPVSIWHKMNASYRPWAGIADLISKPISKVFHSASIGHSNKMSHFPFLDYTQFNAVIGATNRGMYVLTSATDSHWTTVTIM